MNQATTLVKQRPAESFTLAAAIAFLFCRWQGIEDLDVITALTVAIASVPTLVTLLIEKVPVIRRLLGFDARYKPARPKKRPAKKRS